MDVLSVRKAPLRWWVGGLLLGFCQLWAVYINKPLGVSTQFVVLDARVLHAAAPEYAAGHPLISRESYQRFGSGWWLNVGLVAGAALAALVVRRWRFRATTVWAAANSYSCLGRFVLAFFGGFMILLGARLAHGCTSGQFVGGWTQLSLSVLPFTVGLFGVGMITAYLIYPRTPTIE